MYSGHRRVCVQNSYSTLPHACNGLTLMGTYHLQYINKCSILMVTKVCIFPDRLQNISTQLVSGQPGHKYALF